MIFIGNHLAVSKLRFLIRLHTSVGKQEVSTLSRSLGNCVLVSELHDFSGAEVEF